MNNDSKDKDEPKSKNVISLVPREDNPAVLSRQEKKDSLVNYLIKLAKMIEEGELPGDRAVLLFYEIDEDEEGFRFSPRTIGITSAESVTLCELAKDIFIREMLGD